MRMRKKKNCDERIEACSHLLCRDFDKLSVDPHYPFENNNPIHLEIGCGKGGFINQMSLAYPNVNFFALEKISDALVLALEAAAKRNDDENKNLRFILADAKNLTSYFPAHSIERIYLNFSDPWPKKKHAKRRLTYRTFLQIYKDLLTPDGALYFKTDNEGLFDFSIEEFGEFGAKIDFITRNLHASELAATNIMTEYEKNFSSQGMPIYSAHIHF